MSKKSVTVVKKNPQAQGTQTTPKPSTSPTVAPKSAQTIQPSPIPKPPPLPQLVDPITKRIQSMGDYLDRSEGRAGPSGTSTSSKNPQAHARAEHSGRTGAQLESRGKEVDGAFMTPYDQNKALAMMLGTTAGHNAQQSAKTKKGEVVETGMPKPTAKPWMTSPLVRQVKKNTDGSYEHYNAKVNKSTAKFSKDTGMTEGARVQTLYGSDVTPLEKPLPGGTAPKDRVKLDSITDIGKLRKTTTEVKGSVASDTIGSNYETLAPSEDGLTARPTLGKVVDPPKVHEPVGESTNAPSPTPITSDQGASLSSDTAESEVVSDTEGGGTEVGGVPSEGVSTDKQVESGAQAETVTPTPVTVPKPKAVVHQPGKKKFKQKSTKKTKKKGKGKGKGK
jgi:hypothetical protein